MPVGLVAALIYCGMVASDFALYGIGAGARRLPWLSRLAVDERVRGFGETLKRNLFGLVALCRVVPGVVFIAFVACGWTRVSLARFTVASLVVSALYLPLMLYLVVFFGDALDDHAGLWTWPFLLSVLAAIGFIRWQVFSFQKTSGSSETAAAAFDSRRGTPAAPRLAHHGGIGRAHPSSALFPAPCIELDRLRVAIPLSDLADRRQSTHSDRWHVGRIEERLSVRCRRERAPVDCRLHCRAAQRRAADRLHRPRTCARTTRGRRSRVSARRQARHRLAGSRRAPDRRLAGPARLSARLPGGCEADSAALRAARRERRHWSTRGCRGRRTGASSRSRSAIVRGLSATDVLACAT